MSALSFRKESATKKAYQTRNAPLVDATRVIWNDSILHDLALLGIRKSRYRNVLKGLDLHQRWMSLWLRNAQVYASPRPRMVPLLAIEFGIKEAFIRWLF